MRGSAVRFRPEKPNIKQGFNVMSYIETCSALTKVFFNLSDILSLTDGEIKNILQVNDAYLAGLKPGRDFLLYDSKSGKRAIHFVMLCSILFKVVGKDLYKIMEWLTSYNKEFDSVPLLYIQKKKNNMKEIIQYLKKVHYGP